MFFNDSDSDKGDVSSKMKEKTIFWSQTGLEHVILAICPPPPDPEKG